MFNVLFYNGHDLEGHFAFHIPDGVFPQEFPANHIKVQSIDRPASIRYTPHTSIYPLGPKSSHDTTTADVTWQDFFHGKPKFFIVLEGIVKIFKLR